LPHLRPAAKPMRVFRSAVAPWTLSVIQQRCWLKEWPSKISRFRLHWAGGPVLRGSFQECSNLPLPVSA